MTPAVDCAALRLGPIAGHGHAALTILTPFDRPVAIERAAAICVVRPRRWLHALDRALVDARPYGTLTTIATASIRLLPYQLEPALAMLRDGATRLLIADGVGLGKTIQAGIILRELSARGEGFRGLVLTPAGLRDQWSRELASHFGIAVTNADALWLKTTTRDRPPEVNPWSLPGIYIASHDFVKRLEALRPLEHITWDLLVVDEAHAASTGTDRRAAVDAIGMRAARVVLLTATPPIGDPAAFASLCAIGRLPGDASEPLCFARTREDVDAGQPRRTTVLAVTPSDAERRMHELLRRYSLRIWREAAARTDDRARLVSIVLRKRALSSAASLARSVLRRAMLLTAPDTSEAEQLSLGFDADDGVDDDEPSAVLAAPGLSDPVRERRWLNAIADAARTAARDETKLRRLWRLLHCVHEPVIVFTEYRDTLTRLQRRLAATGRQIVTLHGGMSLAERNDVPRVFNRGGHTLLATDAAAEGLNLHHRCRIVVHYELPWNPMRLEQRAGRVDRLGQSRRVHEIALVAADSAEALVIAPLVVKSTKATRSTRAGATGQSQRMLEALTESRIADVVMAHNDAWNSVLPSQTSGSRARLSTPAPTQSDEALNEAARLARERVLLHRSADTETARIDGPFVTALRPRSRTLLTRGLVLIYQTAIDTATGHRLHVETSCVTVRHDASRDVPRTAKALRAWLEPFVTPAAPQLRAIVDSTDARLLHSIGERHTRAQTPVADRLSAIAGLATNTTQRLTQPGLFERRSLRPTPAFDIADVEPEPTPATVTETSPLRAETTLIAALAVD